MSEKSGLKVSELCIKKPRKNVFNERDRMGDIAALHIERIECKRNIASGSIKRSLSCIVLSSLMGLMRSPLLSITMIEALLLYRRETSNGVRSSCLYRVVRQSSAQKIGFLGDDKGNRCAKYAFKRSIFLEMRAPFPLVCRRNRQE